MSIPPRIRKRQETKSTAFMKVKASLDPSLDYNFGNVPTHWVSEKTIDEDTSWPMAQEIMREDPDGYSAQRIKAMDWGGDFRNEKVSELLTPGRWYSNTLVGGNGGTNYYFTGFTYPRVDKARSLGAPIPEADVSNLIGLGSTAMAKASPTNPVADLAVFSGELFRDGLPNIIGKTVLKDRIGFFRSLGDEYLNVEFGWKPFISDFRKFLTVVRDHHKILAQYERDSGKAIRRRYRFPTVKIDTQIQPRTAVQVEPLGPSPCYIDSAGFGMQSGVRTYTKDYWFSGSYTYYLSKDRHGLSGLERWEQEANKLLGIRLTPEVLWNLTPWSWLADWIGNFGDVLHNLSMLSNDGLVVKYGYIMGHLTCEDSYEHEGCSWKYASGGSGIGRRKIVREYKLRQHATPFGFGLDPSTDFSAKQWSIIAALGLSRSNRIGW